MLLTSLALAAPIGGHVWDPANPIVIQVADVAPNGMDAPAFHAELAPSFSADELDTLRRMYGFRYDIRCTPAVAEAPVHVSCSIVPAVGASPPDGVRWTTSEGASSTDLDFSLDLAEPGEVEVDVCLSSPDCEESLERCDHIVLASCRPLDPVLGWTPIGVSEVLDGDFLVEATFAQDDVGLCIESAQWTVSRAPDDEVVYEIGDRAPWGTDGRDRWWDDPMTLRLPSDGELYLVDLELTGAGRTQTFSMEVDLRTEQPAPKQASDRACGCSTGGGTGLGLLGLLGLLVRRR